MSTFTLFWDQLSFSVPDDSVGGRKQILVNHNGHVTSGTMTAIMGPSGAGKTTLLNCITGKLKDGREGQVLVKGAGKMKISFVPQFDALYEQFTVFETLLFASKMKNPAFKMAEHLDKVSRVSDLVDLSGQRDVKVKGLSGGQKKRLCIGVEIASPVGILVLDEPTTGLDSSTSLLLMSNLRDIAISQSIAIVSTIHQPSNEVLNAFDKIYLMSTKGVNIYFGHPSQLLSYLVERAVKCPTNKSLGEIAMSACLDDVIEKAPYTSISNMADSSAFKKLKDTKQTSSGSVLYEVKHLWSRSFQGRAFKTPMLIAEILFTAALWAMASRITKEPIGEEDGCQIAPPNEVLTPNELRHIVIAKNGLIMTVGNVYFSIFLFMADLYAAVIAILFVTESTTLKRELQNGWYRLSSLYWSLMMQGIFDAAIASAVSVTVFVLLTEMLHVELWRLGCFLFFITVHTFSFWMVGLALGCYMKDEFTSLLVGLCSSNIPTIMISTFIVRHDQAPAILKPFFTINFFDQSYRATLSVLYGFGRCDAKLAQEKSLLGELAMSQLPYKIISDHITATEISNSTVHSYSNLLDVDDAMLTNVANKFLALVDEYRASRADSNEASYLLQRLGIANDGHDLAFNCFFVALAVLGLMTLNFVVLKKSMK
ncbi:ABC transporter G family member 1 [Halotydeus destructor]|nr:ABC transporter G family member 1 [Halotydeus destructor]